MDKLPPQSFLHSSITPVEHTRNQLPHWHRDALLHFITFRLADSLPESTIRKLNQERLDKLNLHGRPLTLEEEQTLQNTFTRKLESQLDLNFGTCLLRAPSISQITANALHHFEGVRHNHIAWVIMPNHVHLVCEPLTPHTVADLVGSWKSYTSRQIHNLQGSSGSLWQKDYFDRAIRDGSHLANCIRYIRRNPIKAKLHEDEYRLWESDLARSIF